MGIVKKHPFLEIEYHSSTRLTPAEQKKLRQYLSLGGEVFEDLVREKIIKAQGKKTPRYMVSLLICGDQKIRTLNRDYREKDKVTDVLSFPAHESLRQLAAPGEFVHLGDLAISLPQARRQAKEFSIGVWDEFVHLFFHGLIHLLGYDHEISIKEEKLMQKWEDRALELFSAKKKGP